MKKTNKKGQTILDNFGALAIGVATLGILLVIAFLIINESRDYIINGAGEACGNTTHTYNTTAGLCCRDGASFNCDGTNRSGLSQAFNATNSLGNATAEVDDWVSLIIVAAVGASLLALLVLFRRKGE